MAAARGVKAVTPDGRAFPEFDDTSRAFQQETELFIESNLRENVRSPSC